MLVVSAVSVLALAGCGESDTLDDGKVEDFIRDEARVPQAIETVTCPEDREVKKGETFECTIVAKDGSEEVVELQRKDDDDGEVVIVANRQTKLPADRKNLEIVPENVEDLIRGAAREPERLVSVDCPAGIGLKKGQQFDCTVRYDDASEEIVEITQRDELGNVEITGSKKGEGNR